MAGAGCESAAKRERVGENDVGETSHSPVEAQGSSGQGLRSLAIRDIMPGGEGSSINLLDHHHHHRASTAATTSTTDECANGDDVKTGTSTGATFTSTMTSALAGDGLRRRKVIHAARETLDKGKSGPLRRPLSRYHRVPRLRNLAQPLLSSPIPGTNPECPIDSQLHEYRGIDPPSPT